MAQAAQAVIDIVDKTRSGVIATALNHLEVFRDPFVAANTSASDFTAADFLGAESPTSLYLTIAPERSLLVGLEEFTARGRLDFLDQSIAYLRGYGVKLLISIQSL